MSFLNKLERIFGRFSIPNLSLYLIVGQVFFWGLALMIGFDLGRIALLPVAVVTGSGASRPRSNPVITTSHQKKTSPTIR